MILIEKLQYYKIKLEKMSCENYAVSCFIETFLVLNKRKEAIKKRIRCNLQIV
jgi:hypothetical protein